MLKDLGELNYFLGIEKTKSKEYFHLDQYKYIAQLLKKAQLTYAKKIMSRYDG